MMAATGIDYSGGTNNQVIGETPSLKNSAVRFKGDNNILYCEPGVVLADSVISFGGDNSVVFLGSSRHEYKLSVSMNYDNAFYMGRNNYINSKLMVILSEQRHCIIGADSVISYGICIRNADPHLIYDCDSLSRQNLSRSIFIGDHVWIGQDSLILKGTQIDSGCIVGGMSVIAGKHLPHNSAWAGNPARKIKNNVFWNGDSVHAWQRDRTENSKDYDKYIDRYHKGDSVDAYIYSYVEEEAVDYDMIDSKLCALEGSQSKLDYLLELNKHKSKNRFVHNVDTSLNM